MASCEEDKKVQLQKHLGGGCCGDEHMRAKLTIPCLLLVLAAEQAVAVVRI